MLQLQLVWWLPLLLVVMLVLLGKVLMLVLLLLLVLLLVDVVVVQHVGLWAVVGGLGGGAGWLRVAPRHSRVVSGVGQAVGRG